MPLIDDDNFILKLNQFVFKMHRGKLDVHNADDDSIHRMIGDHEEFIHLLARALMAKSQGTPYTCPVRSRYVTFYFCDNCDNIHVALKDANNHIYTEAVLSDAMVLKAASMIIEYRQEIFHDNSPSTSPDLP